MGQTYINEHLVGVMPVYAQDIDLNYSQKTVYDVGVKRDTFNYMNGFVRDLMIIRRAIREERVLSMYLGKYCTISDGHASGLRMLSHISNHAFEYFIKVPLRTLFT